MSGRIKPPGAILVVALDNLGDLVFASALFPPLRAAFPDADLAVWCKRYTLPIAPLLPHVQRIYAGDPFWAPRPGYQRPPMMPFLRSIADVRKRMYDVAVLSEAPWRTAAVVRWAGARTRIGLARHRNGLFLTHRLPAQDAHRSVLKEQARLLAPLGITPPVEPRYRLDPDRLGKLRGEIARELPSRFAALHAFASHRNRCVPLEHWLDVAAELSTRGFHIVWIGTTGELDELRAHPAAIDALYVDRIGDGSLRATAAVLSHAALFIGHDSGPLHIAGAFGVPVVGIYAPGQPDRTYPQGTGPSRMIVRPAPAGIDAATILREVDALGLTSLA